MTEKEYEEAKAILPNKKEEIILLERNILEYENKNKRLIIEDSDDLNDFLIDEPEEGLLFDYKGETFEVGDIEEFIRDYGGDQYGQSIQHSLSSEENFGDLVYGGRVGILKRV